MLDSDQVIEKKPGALRNGAPFAELPAPLLQLQTALRRRERQQADRIMAKVLSLVPMHGLEAVLVAVELVLESGAPSAEHVSNVLARLKQTDMPALGQSKVDQQLIYQLATMEFTTAAQNLVLVGGTGTGKTHLTIAIGTSGIQHHNKKVRFGSRH